MLQPLPKGDNRPVLLMNKPSCAVPPAAQASNPSVTEVTSAPTPSPVVQQGKYQVEERPTHIKIMALTTHMKQSLFKLTIYVHMFGSCGFSLVVCTVATTASPRPMQPTPQTAVRISTPKPVLTVRAPPASSTANNPTHPNPTPMPQRVLLSPDMQARLPCKYAWFYFNDNK